MAPSAIAQRRTHNLLLFQKLLNLRDGASPFTLVLDTLEQSGKPVMREFMLRAQISKTKIVYLSFQTLKKPRNVDVFIQAHGKSLQALRAEIDGHVPSPTPGSAITANSGKSLIIFDSLHPLCSASPAAVMTFLSSLLSPIASVLAVYHVDVPISDITPSVLQSPYSPSPLSTLLYLATAILQVSRFSHELAKKKARDKSLPEPGFGIKENREGVIVGLGGMSAGNDGTKEVVVDMEVRRKSGRGIREVFILTPVYQSSNDKAPLPVPSAKTALAHITLLDDHPSFARPIDPGAETHEQADGEEPDSTFSMGLTEKQRRDREGVVLPYFDAQKGDGPGEGGRILYEMGREDDYDEDEDDEF